MQLRHNQVQSAWPWNAYIMQVNARSESGSSGDNGPALLLYSDRSWSALLAENIASAT